MFLNRQLITCSCVTLLSQTYLTDDRRTTLQQKRWLVLVTVDFDLEGITDHRGWNLREDRLRVEPAATEQFETL